RPARPTAAVVTAPTAPAGQGSTSAASGRRDGDSVLSPAAGSSGPLELGQRLLDADLLSPQAVNDVGDGGRRFGVDEVEVLGDPVEPGLDRRVAHSEDSLHLLDRPVRVDKGGDKNLVIDAELG